MKFEIFVRHSNRDVNWARGRIILEPQRGVWTGDINLEHLLCIWDLAMGLRRIQRVNGRDQ